jgi:hypothetical protein
MTQAMSPSVWRKNLCQLAGALVCVVAVNAVQAQSAYSVKPNKPVQGKSPTSAQRATATSAATNKATQAAAARATALLQAQAIAEAAAVAQSSQSPSLAPSAMPATALAAVPDSAVAAPAILPLPRSTLSSSAPQTVIHTHANSLVHTAHPNRAVGELADEQMAVAERVHLGLLPCEMGASVRVEADVARPGFFHVRGKGFRYHMHPVRSSTGAIRLEDAKAGAVWLQLANKSMLMDQTKGRRVADECAHPAQLAYAQGMKTNPPPDLFDTSGKGQPQN